MSSVDRADDRRGNSLGCEKKRLRRHIDVRVWRVENFMAVRLVEDDLEGIEERILEVDV